MSEQITVDDFIAALCQVGDAITKAFQPDTGEQVNAIFVADDFRGRSKAELREDLARAKNNAEEWYRHLLLADLAGLRTETAELRRRLDEQEPLAERNAWQARMIEALSSQLDEAQQTIAGVERALHPFPDVNSTSYTREARPRG